MCLGGGRCHLEPHPKPGGPPLRGGCTFLENLFKSPKSKPPPGWLVFLEMVPLVGRCVKGMWVPERCLEKKEEKTTDPMESGASVFFKALQRIRTLKNCLVIIR